MISNINNQKIEIIEFHINQFPSDRVHIYLDEDFHKKVFSKIRQYKFKQFNKLFFENKLNWSTFKLWKRRGTDLKIRIKNHFIPLWFILKLSEIFPEFSIEEFEKNIFAMKGPSSSSIIYNPNLPLREDGRLLKIIAHFLGDGHVDGAFGSNLSKGKSHSEYRNYNPIMLDSFEKDLQTFGQVKISKDYRHGHIIVPNLIGYILEHIYKIKFDCHNSRVPETLFLLPRELIASFLRAFCDDEGHVYDSSVEYYSTNKELLQDTLRLMNMGFPEIETSKVKTNSSRKKYKHSMKYYFTIYNNSQKEYLNLIGFDHQQKREDLIFNITRKGLRNKNPKGKILELLKNDILTAKQISRMMGIRHSSVLEHLSELKKLGKVKIVKKEHWTNFWAIKF
ncbi:ArsR family transcriptional regulator [Candidatus Woesearchaeota archaeon]|nr:ArsR family transcriptional regulator [Candidatus Woesearchaeota archaeon]